MLSVKSHKEKGALLADSIFAVLKKIHLTLKKKTSKARILHRKGYERGSKFSYFDCQCEGEGDKSL